MPVFDSGLRECCCRDLLRQDANLEQWRFALEKFYLPLSAIWIPASGRCRHSHSQLHSGAECCHQYRRATTGSVVILVRHLLPHSASADIRLAGHVWSIHADADRGHPYRVQRLFHEWIVSHGGCTGYFPAAGPAVARLLGQHGIYAGHGALHRKRARFWEP